MFSFLDPMCGPFGLFTLLGTGLLSCGDIGWADEISQGIFVTVTLALATLPFGLLIGFLIALAKQSNERSLRLAADVYTTIFRGLPELLTIFIVYFGLQIAIRQFFLSIGVESPPELNAFSAGLIALGLVFSSYASEVLLSAFRAIPQGQYEAGYALGMTRVQTMVKIIAPQLVRIALPGLGNLWMILLKDTALISVIGIADILRQTGIASRVTKEPFLFFGLACLIYLILAMLSSVVISAIEKRSKRGEVR